MLIGGPGKVSDVEENDISWNFSISAFIRLQWKLLRTDKVVFSIPKCPLLCILYRTSAFIEGGTIIRLPMQSRPLVIDIPKQFLIEPLDMNPVSLSCSRATCGLIVFLSLFKHLVKVPLHIQIVYVPLEVLSFVVNCFINF